MMLCALHSQAQLVHLRGRILELGRLGDSRSRMKPDSFDIGFRSAIAC